MNHVLNVTGQRIAYRQSKIKAGIPIVLLHGFCEDSSVWDAFVPHFNDRHIIRLDSPGFGASDLSPKPGMDMYADAVRSVLDHLSIDKCVLTGHSMGGYAALEFAALYPERLAGLGLFHSHPYEDTAERKEARRRGIEMLQSGKRDLYVAQLFPGLFAEAFAKENPQVVNALIDNGKRQSPESIIAALEGMIARKNHEETLRNATCPVLFLLGSEDTIVTPAIGLQAAVLPNISEVKMLPGVGHTGMFEAPEKCARIVQAFWQFCVTR